MDFYRANHPENSANEIQLIQAKIIIDLENRLAGAVLFSVPKLLSSRYVHHIRQRR